MIKTLRFKGCGLFLLGLLLINSACNNHITAPKPKNLISPDSLTVFLEESFIIEATLSGKPPEEYRPLAQSYYDSLFSKHHFTKQDLIESLNYYTSKDKSTTAFLENVTNKLIIRESQVDQEFKKLHPEGSDNEENKNSRTRSERKVEVEID